MPELNAYARERLTELNASNAHPAVISHVNRLLAEGDDFDVYKVNAFRVAEETQVPRGEALRGFLYATKLGLFDLAYDIHCPSCKGIPDQFRHLMKVGRRSRCPSCENAFEVDFEKHVEVTFTVNPAVRPMPYSELTGEVYARFGRRERRDFAAQQVLAPGQKSTMEATLGAGE